MTLNKYAAEHILFFDNGEKMRFACNDPETIEENVQKITSEFAPAKLEFITNAENDFPFDYDWDEKLGKWQSRIF